MPYITLSDQIKKLGNSQRSDSFVKKLREAVREGEIDAADLPGHRFELPKQFSKRGSTETYSRTVRDMIIDGTPEFEAWFQEANKDLSSTRSGKIRVSAENIDAGLVDFKALAAQTRARMQASQSKGQALGKGRTATTKKSKANK
ncbi:hypothetical protein MF271_19340 (plasmid) [Deinococcus sp. KNUC1210]|uniref:hypothetical protein n=1 Tax=Deinococcus sp. KNUC1210 TaxID=2917691 RepID=UPI001EF06299|nr:hypothetical protein [Deinococcus sp. KNUC1210]ULH17346.1 hypothetical protein MF271_19340 [Deinococcus sp. KNUC1210]